MAAILGAYDHPASLPMPYAHLEHVGRRRKGRGEAVEEAAAALGGLGHDLALVNQRLVQLLKVRVAFEQQKGAPAVNDVQLVEYEWFRIERHDGARDVHRPARWGGLKINVKGKLSGFVLDGWGNKKQRRKEFVSRRR